MYDKDKNCRESNICLTFKYYPNIASGKYYHKIRGNFSHNKDKIKPTNPKYNISCSEYNSIYIGESSQIAQKKI